MAALATATLPSFSSVGPVPVLNGQDPGSGSVSGRIAAIAVDPTNASTFYIAAAGGGVWKTTDGGASFTPLTDGLPDLAMGALAIDPNNHNVIYAGSGEANFSQDSRYGGGVYKSTDGGSTWTVYTGPGGTFAGNAISRIVVDPSNSNNVYLTTAYATNGIYGGWGVYKSTNGGQTWAYVFSSVDSNETAICTDLAIDPVNPQTLYAAVGYIFGYSENGIYKSTNGGGSWTRLANFPSGSNVGRISLALAPSNPSILYADYSTQVSSNTGGLGGFYVSTDGGSTWTQRTSTPNFLGTQGWYDNTISVSPTNPNLVIAAGVINYNAQGTIGIIGSFDGGVSWTDFSYGTNGQGPHTDHHALAFTSTGALLDGNDGGLWRLAAPISSSTILWSDLNATLNTIQFTGIALHPTDPNTAYGGSQDNGTEKYTGSTAWTEVQGGDGGFTRVDQTNPNTVYHEFFGISLERSDDGGMTWTQKITGINQSAAVPDDGDDPAAFYVPYILDPANQSRVLYGTDNLYESTNRADSFTPIGSVGVNGFNTDTVNGPGVVSAIGAYGPTVYVSTSDSHIYVTTNNGGAWVDRDVPGEAAAPSDIYVNPNYPADAIVTIPAFTGGSAGHVFRTTDLGVTWRDISGNLPDQPYNAVKLDKRSGTLMIGGDDGVYTSTNFGGTWTKSNLPNVQVVDLAVSPGAGVAAAGTHGRGMFEATLPSTVAVPNVSVSVTLSRSNGQLLATIILKNVSNADATNVTINSVTLNGTACTPQNAGSQNAGVVPAAAQSSGIVYVCPNAASNTIASLVTRGSTGQGSFSSALKIRVP